ncbi:putative tubulin polyglutamylase TTLL9 [Triplophysa tibetana]|uniref:Tubulin--tyrosine ligase-like protein 9 n=1 Tax=Triplophysa tibetana TaxID=1572043 RepID=A0A5A9NC23_9TELE|nr:putative tubulin polyglutamylase TTLL9 [Triplophysa tibetana]
MSRNRTAAHKGHQKKKEGEGRSCIRYRCGLTNTIQDILNHRPGWVEVKEDGEWDFNWCDVGWLRENFDHSYMGEHMRICHFRNHYELTRKNLMVKNLKRYRKSLERESGRLEASKCDFFPRTFELPSEYHIFVEEFKRNPGSTWIMKPDGTRSEEQKEEAQVESYVAQRYIENPYLIADVHLTNVAVQKTAPDYDPEKGCKWQMHQLRRYLTAKHGLDTVQTLFKEIDNIFIRSLLSVQKTIINDKHCFELYGYDILLDQDLKPWLIEVNASPSLTASSQEDFDMKYRLLEDTLHVVDMEGRLTGKEKRIGGYDLMWNDGPVYKDDGLEALGGSYLIANTHLG